MSPKAHLVLATLIVLVLSASGCSELDRVVRSVDPGALPNGGTRSLDAGTVAAGLKEALRVGSGRTVEVTGRVDGFLGNALIRIALPQELRSAGDALRRFGLGSRVDALEVAMNRAAERAAGEARPILWDAVQAMTIRDAFDILNGGDTAATAYLQRTTEARLRDRLRPLVTAKMEEVDLYRLYGSAIDAYRRLPVAAGEPVDLDTYVTDRTLKGLFTVLAQEERRIREQPAARTTELLRRVFGS